MQKTYSSYWNPLTSEAEWQPVVGCDGVDSLTLATDPQTGHYTRLTRFSAGADTTKQGVQSHAYPEEIFIVSGSLYDKSFDLLLRAGDYASRPPGEKHGPFVTVDGCVVLELAYPNLSEP